MITPVSTRSPLLNFVVQMLPIAESLSHYTYIGHPVRLQPHTASDISIVCKSTWRKTSRQPIQMASLTATSACCCALELTGQLQSTFKYRDKLTLIFYLTELSDVIFTWSCVEISESLRSISDFVQFFSDLCFLI